MSREGLETPVDSSWEPPGTIAAASLSPDGTALAAEIVANGNSALWIKHLPSGPASRVTFGDTANLRPTWSADGRSLVYIGNAGANGGQVMRRRADGTGAAQVLVKSPFAFAQASETQDGKWMLARRSFLEAGSGDIYGSARRFDADAAGDGAGHRDRAGGVARRALARLHLERVGAAGGVRAAVPRRGVGAVAGVGRRRARPDVVAQRQGAVLPEHRQQDDERGIRPGATFGFEQPRALFSTAPYVPGGPMQSYDVSPDDRRFVMLRETSANERSEFIVVEGWTSELRARTKR